MSNDQVTVHMIVKNEDRFLWYSISSVLPFADRLFIYDTGSSDNSEKIIRSFKDERVVFEKKPVFTPSDLTGLRQEQVDKTEGDWIWIVDGDEIYPFSLGREIRDIVNNQGDKLEGIVVGRYDLIGDIYHYQTDTVGTYNMFGKLGHFVLRLVNKKNVGKLKVVGDYPLEGYYDGINGQPLIKHSKDKYRFTRGRLFHAMYLKRSTRGASLKHTLHREKSKIETGLAFDKNFQQPEVFYFVRPAFVPYVTGRRSTFYEILAFFVTPIKTVKRLLWRLFK